MFATCCLDKTDYDSTLSYTLPTKFDACACLQALEYQMQQGLADGARENLFLMPQSAQHEYGPPLHANVCVVRLLEV